MIDTHSHLNFPNYQKNLSEVIRRAKQKGVEKIICVSSNIADSRKALVIAQKYPDQVYAAVGIHPHQTDPENKDSPELQLEQLNKLAQHPRVVAIGECGLDYSPAPPGEKNRSLAEQSFLLEKQIQIAQKLNLPLLIHARQAFAETVSILKGRGVRGVFHCYSAGKKGITEVSSLNFYFGVDGNLTYDIGLQNVFRLIPLEKILLETDAPFLTPLPYRGQTNEPSFLVLIAQKLAEIKETSLKKVDEVTTKNALRLLNLK